MLVLVLVLVLVKSTLACLGCHSLPSPTQTAVNSSHLFHIPQPPFHFLANLQSPVSRPALYRRRIDCTKQHLAHLCRPEHSLSTTPAHRSSPSALRQTANAIRTITSDYIRCLLDGHCTLRTGARLHVSPRGSLQGSKVCRSQSQSETRRCSISFVSFIVLVFTPTSRYSPKFLPPLPASPDTEITKPPPAMPLINGQKMAW